MSSSLTKIVAKLREFRDARDWGRFHTVKNLIVSLNLESAELLELCQWKSDEEFQTWTSDQANKKILAAECADVLSYLLLITDQLGIDLLASTDAKIVENETRYPVDKSMGIATKYDKL